MTPRLPVHVSPHSDHRRRMAAYIATKTGSLPPARHVPGERPRDTYAGFTDLPPELRNRIYELIAPPRHQHVTICAAEKDARDVPYPLSRTCRLVRQETAPYFLSGEGATVILVLYSDDDVRACRDWISFVPAYSLGEVRTIKVKHAHSCRRSGCEMIYVLQLDEEQPVRWHGQMRTDCQGEGAYQLETGLIKALVGELAVEVEGSRAGGRKMTRGCLEGVVRILEGP